jgi:hypothetical protein
MMVGVGMSTFSCMQMILFYLILRNVNHYKYLGIIVDEFLDFNVRGQFLADSGNRPLGAIIIYKNTKLHTSGVFPYFSEVSGHKGFK